MKNKYFYQIYKLKIKPWIKYWLIKAGEIKGVLSEILTGTSFYLEDSIFKKFKLFKIYGNTTQESTTGKNKIDVTSGTTNMPDTITLSQNSDGTLSFNGTNTAGVGLYIINGLNFSNIINGNSYRMITKIKSGTWNNGSIGLQFRNSENTQFVTLQNTSTSQETKEFTDDVAKVNLYIGSSFSATNLVIEIMLVEASVTDDTFEPYTGGEPAPSPSYPYPIKSAGDNVNLFDKDDTTILNQYITENGIVQHGSGTPSEKSFVFSCKPNTIYTLSKLQTARLRIAESNTNFNVGSTYNVLINDSTSGNIKATFTTGINTNNLFIFFYNNTGETYTLQEVLDSIKLEQGTKATPYSPYGCGNVNEKISNKNLLVAKKIVKDSNNQDVYLDNDGNIIFKTQNRLKIKPSVLKQNTAYTFELKVHSNSNATNNIRFDVHYTDGTTQTAVAETGTISDQNIRTLIFSSNPNKTIDYVSDQYTYGVVSTLVVDGSMIIEGEYTAETIPNYIPHAEQNISFPLAQGQFLAEDEELKDDGKENLWGIDTVTGTTKTFTDAKTNGRYYCNQKVAGTLNGQTISFDTSVTNAIVQYELASPTTTPYTEEQQTAYNQIKELYTYSEKTNISSTDTTPPYLEIQYWKEA